MAKKPTKRAQAWVLFDHIVANAPLRDTSPWDHSKPGEKPGYSPDYNTLETLLGVPLHLKADTQSMVPALALDVWVAYELRRAGLDADSVWPRAEHPRVLPREVARFMTSLTGAQRKQIAPRLLKGTNKGSTPASANLLGKNYIKQVDVVMSAWDTGPELMISTKRMDSSFQKNAANRVEESYGDAKNLKNRHPLAALGYVFGLRSTCWDQHPTTAAWIVDLLTKLGREDDAYDAVMLVVPEYGGESPEENAEEPAPPGLEESEDTNGETADEEAEDLERAAAELDIPATIATLPQVKIRHDLVTAPLSPSRFFPVMLARVLDGSPITMHTEARARRDNTA